MDSQHKPGPEARAERRLRELEHRNEALERLISDAGEILGHEALTIAGRANAWLGAIVDSSDDAIVSKDLDGIVTSWNPAAEHIFGYTAAEMVGSSILRIVPPALHDEEPQILAKIRAGQRIDHFQTVRRRKDGQMVHVSVTISPVRNARGEIVGASKIARNIDGQRDADRAKGLLAAIVESSHDAIMSKDLTGVVTSWNRAAERLFGFAAREMIGAPVTRIIPPELHEEENLILAKVRAGERIDGFETVRVARDGRRIDVSVTISPVRNSAGAIVGVSNLTRDLHAQRLAERDQATLAAIVTGSDDAIISKTLDGTVTSWNPAAERLYGLRSEEMVGQSILRIIPPHLHSEEEYILSRIRAGESLEHFETVRMRKDGKLVEVSLTVSPLRDSLGRLIGASKIARDITEQREERRKKDQFLAILAHELRNPLAAIRYSLALSSRPGVGEDDRARAHGIAERQLGHMAHLLDDLLDISRITTGRVELKPERVALAPLLEDAIDAARPAFTQKRHELRVARADAPIWLDADPARITQIFANLLANAAKYTDPGGRIELAVTTEDGEAVVTVTDNGIGFRPEMRSRLFMLFSQDPESLSRASGGLGIGLALVREFVERHGGSVDAQSAGRGQGSRFTVRLPVAQPPEASPPAPAP